MKSVDSDFLVRRIGKAPGFSPEAFRKKVGVHLLSRNRSTIGRYGLTSVFGMEGAPKGAQQVFPAT